MRPTCFETEQRLMQAHPDVSLAYSSYDVIDPEGYIRSERPDVRGAHVKTSEPIRAEYILFVPSSAGGTGALCGSEAIVQGAVGLSIVAAPRP